MDDSQHTQNFLIDFWTLFFDPRVTVLSKSIFVVFAGAYVLSPIDVIPDVLLPLGVVDDGGLLVTAMFVFVRQARQQLENRMMSEEEKLPPGGERSLVYYANSNNSGCARTAQGCFIGAGVLALILVVGMAVTIGTGLLTFNGLIASIGDFLGQPTTATVMSSRTIVGSLKPLGQLVSISVEVAKADIGVSVNTGGLNLCGHSANHVAQGVVEAGVDITQVDEDNVSYDQDTDTYTLNLPAPNLTSCRIEYIRQYEQNGGSVACPVDWDTVRLLAQYEATTLFAADTLQTGILDRAERETTLLMQSFVGALTGSEVKVVYGPTSAEPALPPSCQPQIPQGWVYDAELKTWEKTG